ncbi:MAG: ABC transporter ATP-binding protein/permease [Bacilli bacterium]|nr:ABC transporter ATP-binding protein/permease [Bacilli bacterium]
MIAVKELSKTYAAKGSAPEGKALDGVSFKLQEKGLVFILGKSGSGKSTLLHLLGGLLGPTSGDIVVDGTSISSLDRDELEKYRNTCVGVVFQDFKLLDDLSVADNVALALSLQGRKDRGEVELALAKVGMNAYAKRKCLKLSGGQRQRVALARAIVKNPAFVLADEPTGSLDSATGTAIMELFKELSNEKLIVVVSHDRGFAERFGDRIIELSDGKIVNDSDKNPVEGPLKNSLILKKSRLPFKDAFRMGLKSLRHNGKRLFASILLSLTAFTLFGLISTAISVDPARAIANSISLSKNKELFISNRVSASPTYKKEIGQIEKAAGGKVFFKEVARPNRFRGDVEIVSKGRLNSGIQGSHARKVYDITSFANYSYLVEDDLRKSGFTIDGDLPEKSDEIAISKLLYDSLARNVGLKTYEGVEIKLGRTSTTFRVVGVVDNHFDTSEYEHLRERDMARDFGLKSKLDKELENSFATTVFLSKEAYDADYSTFLSNIYVGAHDDETYYSFGDIDISKTADSLETLYIDYKVGIGKKFIAYNLDYDVDHTNGDIRVGQRWFASHGYVLDGDNGSVYSSTISDEDGEYIVTYRFDKERGVYVRSSERGDERIAEAEMVDLQYLSRSDFLETYFIMPSGHNSAELLKNDDEFIELAEGEIMLSFSELGPSDSDKVKIMKSWDKGRLAASVWNNNEETNIKAVRAFYKNAKDAEHPYEPIFEREIVVGEKDYAYLAARSECFYGFKALCSGDPSADERFIDYFLNKDKNYIDNNTTALLDEIDTSLRFPVNVLSVFAIVFLAVISALVLSNHISMSLAYGKKERGILMALGARNKDLLAIYLFEALLIALMTGTISIIASSLACLLLNIYVSVNYSVAANIFAISFFEPLVIFGSAIVSSGIAAFFPIWRNRNIEPIDILKA